MDNTMLNEFWKNLNAIIAEHETTARAAGKAYEDIVGPVIGCCIRAAIGNFYAAHHDSKPSQNDINRWTKDMVHHLDFLVNGGIVNGSNRGFGNGS